MSQESFSIRPSLQEQARQEAIHQPYIDDTGFSVLPLSESEVPHWQEAIAQGVVPEFSQLAMVGISAIHFGLRNYLRDTEQSFTHATAHSLFENQEDLGINPAILQDVSPGFSYPLATPYARQQALLYTGRSLLELSRAASNFQGKARSVEQRYGIDDEFTERLFGLKIPTQRASAGREWWNLADVSAVKMKYTLHPSAPHAIEYLQLSALQDNAPALYSTINFSAGTYAAEASISAGYIDRGFIQPISGHHTLVTTVKGFASVMHKISK